MKDLNRVSRATGAKCQSTTSGLEASALGTCSLFEENQIGGQRYNIFSGCKQAKTVTIILRGGGEQFIAEMDRSINDALMVVKRARKYRSIVAGGGAIEMELSKHLRQYSRTIMGKQQLIINAFAKALEIIPFQIAANAGLDSTVILNKLRQKHDQGGTNFGVDVINDGICDSYDLFIWEPSLIKLNSIEAATEAACVILSIDETIKNPAASNKIGGDGPMPGPGGRGRGMRM